MPRAKKVTMEDTQNMSEQKTRHECRILLGHLARKRTAIMTSLERLRRIKQPSAEIVAVIHLLTDVLRPDNRLNAVEQAWYAKHNAFIDIMRRVCPMLSLQEIFVCFCLLDNMTTREIANELCRSEKTIDHYRQSIREALGITGGKKILIDTLRALVESETTR
jgi:hypothetical protein